MAERPDLIAEAQADHRQHASDRDLCVECGGFWPCLTARLAAELAGAREAVDILREGLDCYAPETSYRLDGFPLRDRGMTARAALKAAEDSLVRLGGGA